MKKIIVYHILFIFLCFGLPIILTNRNIKVSAIIDEESQNIEQEEKIEELNIIENSSSEQGEYIYEKYSNIKLLHNETGKIEEVSIDDYICNVVSAEMPVSFELEALKAQAIVARTYTVYKILNKKHENADICDDSSCCQAWISKEDRMAKWEESQRESNWKKICQAVKETEGKVITYENIPINAFFHSNSGGITEIPINVWGGSGYPYLQSVETAGEENYSQYSSEVILTQEELLNILKSKYEDINIDFNNSEDIQILEYTSSNRVKTLKLGNYQISGVEARTILGLKSTNFEITQEENNIKFSVKGYGHGVGMSQTGADSMAKQGSVAEEIIKHFYKDVEIKDINNL